MQPSTNNEDRFFSGARELFEQIVDWLGSETVCGLEHGELETLLLENGYELLRRLLQGYLDRRSNDEIEGDCLGRDGVNRTHKIRGNRKLTTIFGTVIAHRIGYGGRKITSLNPLDAELNLPPEQYSHGLRERVAQEVARSGFGETVEIISKTTAAKVGKRQVEQLAYKSACDFDSFYAQQQAQSVEGKHTGEIVVITVDGKGVVMRTQDLRADTQKRALASSKKLNKRLTKGEKRNAKRMATVASVYTIDPLVRTPEQIVNPSESDQNIKRPRPMGKRVWASLEKEPYQVITEAFDEALHRDPNQQKHFCALVDGNKTQLLLLKKYARQHQLNLTIVLDIIHVIEYLWKAAFAFYGDTSPQGEAWVSQRILLILQGRSSQVAAGMRRSATLRQLNPSQRKPVDTCAQYLLNNSAYLQYNDYLKAGLPIATGVIEGACRHLIKDRMDLTGARWSLMGAEAVLRLRSLYISGDWNEYWRFHLKQEHKRHHLALYLDGIPLMKRLFQACCSTNAPPTLAIPV
ncbi:MAG: ISKra4 family transposase [Moorea sp. SIO3I7]|uniref:ISKra4 family transposase n=1 Tax=unclassified Moorena TaxID=2683338 RepID=UPI0013C5CEA5|nr:MULTISPECIES: ISKra4 family transposase [unclassified Moorena]NEO00534.1 ISKra4 family transposase [Moorena sp. SIO3I7]NEO17795.1 ISKra4 family transposase [Moorena sp. SIO3E8]NEQ04369.1 ISKra4 family transposase [Moorena sp. SIO3F7]NEQ62746.1 ISKra4 family transposase [Moorena sp. SIO4A1]